MDSDAKSTKSEEDSSTKYVLNYYRKFSQNKDLPKYFSGTSLSYLPEIKYEVQNEIPEITIKTDVDVIITSLDEAKQSETVDSSPSSLRSNRKLEWDNGADIGYSNCLPTKKIHKSCSLPLLSELKNKQVAFAITQPSDQPQAPKSESSSGSNVKLVVFPYSSTSDENSSGPKCYSLSSSSPEGKKDVVYSISSTSLSTNGRGVDKGMTPSSSSSTTSQRISSFKSTLSHLKKKIGLPDAHSTPIAVEEVKTESDKLPDTPVIKNHEKPVKQLLLLDKPVEEQPLSTVKEVVQKDSSDSFKKSIESDSDILSNNSQKNPTDTPNEEEIVERKVVKQGKRVINLGVTKPIFVECISTPPLPMNKKIQTQTEHLSVAVQTDHISEEELVKIALESHKNENQSLHFLEHHSSDEKNSCSTQTTTDVEALKCDSFEFVKPDSSGSEADENGNSNVRNQASTNPDEMVQTSHSSSQNIHLAEAVSTNKLDNIGDDIEKSLYILQKLLKSKKYDPATKKRYVKKILRKITESKYFEESSTSSELFFPKKSFKTDSQKIPQNNIVLRSTDSSIERSQHSDLGPSRFPRQSEGKAKVSPRKKTLQIKTFSQNIASVPVLSAKELSSPTEIIPVEARDMRKNLFTLTNNEFSAAQYERHILASKASNIEASMSNNDASLEKHFDSCSTSKSYQNWKQDKTLSEKMIEQKYFTIGDGDNLVNLADKERENKINWINREMKHLDRLKHLLERPPGNEAVAQEKTTTVYSVSRKSDRCDKGDGGSRRKFVIETKLDKELTSHQRNFQLNGNKFTVANSSEHRTETRKPRRPILADIEVTSSDTTTNIIVTTICEKCRRGPCICVDPIGDVAKENICRSCRKRSCTCFSLDAIKSSGTVCLCCRKAICSCSTIFTSTGAIPKRCPLCRSYPCICSSADSKDYDGQFIPVSVPKLVFDGRRDGFLSSSQSPTYSRSSTGCSKCRKCPCVCGASAKNSDSSSREEQTSKQSSMSLSGSLSKVFTNCNCRTKSKCDCGFVERLLRHFEKDDLLKDINFEDNSAQTEPENRADINNVGVQTQSDVRNQNLQTSNHQQSELSQTDESRGMQYPQTTSIQTLSQTKHLKSKSVGSKPYRFSSRAVVTENISHHSVDTQAAAQDGTTMTVGVKETSTENGRLTAIDTGSYQNIAAQTSVEKKHLGSQAAKDWTQIFPSVATEANIKSFQSANIQAASQDGTTMTESMQATSTDDVKEHSICLDEATSYENQQIANREQASQSTETRLQHVSATSQTDNVMPEYGNNMARSRSDTRDASTHVNLAPELSTHGSQTREASAHGSSTPETFSRDTQSDALLIRNASNHRTLTDGSSIRDVLARVASTRSTSTRKTVTRDDSSRRTLTGSTSTRNTIRDTSTRDDFNHEPSVRDVETRDASTHGAKIRDSITSHRKFSMRNAESGNSLTRIVSNRGTSTDGILSRNAQGGQDPLTREASVRDTKTGDSVIRVASTRGTLTDGKSTLDAQTGDDMRRDTSTGGALTRGASVRDTKTGDSLTRIASSRGTLTDGTSTLDAQTGEDKSRHSSTRGTFTGVHSVHDTKAGDSVTRIASSRGVSTDRTSTIDARTGEDKSRDTLARGTSARETSVRDVKTGDSLTRVASTRGTLTDETSTLDAQTGEERTHSTRGTFTREYSVHDTKAGDSVTRIASTRGISTDRTPSIDARTGEDESRETLARGTSARETSVRDVKTGDSLTRVASTRGTLTDGTSTLDAQTGEERTHSTLSRGTFTGEPSVRDVKTDDSLTRVTSTRSTLTDGISTVDAQTGEEKTYNTLTRGTFTRELSARDAKTGDSQVRATSTRGTLTEGTSTLDAKIGEERTYSTLTRGTLTREHSARDAKTGGSLIRVASTRGTLTDGISTRDVQTGEEEIRDTLTRGTFTRENTARDAKTGNSAIRVASTRGTLTDGTSTRDVRTGEDETLNTLTHGTFTRGPSMRDARTSSTVARDASTRDTQTYEAKPTETQTRDASYRISSPELSAHQKTNDEAARSRTRKSSDFENGNALSKDCSCACGFIKKVHGRKRNEMEKEPARMESVNSSGWNESSKMLSSTGTTNATTSSETTTTTTNAQSETSLATCACCKRKTALDQTTMLRTNDEDYPLCRCCAHKKPILTSVCYAGPERVRPCHREGKTASADRFRRVEEYCTCARPSRAQDGRYCCHCQFKLKRTQRSGNGIAYTLTLESESPKRERRHRKRPKRLEEIKVKVPCPYGGKRRKEKENFNRRGGSRSRMRDASLEGEGERYDVSEFEETQEAEKREGGDRETKNKENFTLQEYLRKNRPDFIDSAEYRRQAVVTARNERQQETDDVKLRFIEDNVRNNKFKGTNILFTEKEMKEITKRNYKKLPEVQKKLHNFREQRLRSADKMIVDIFKRKIQGSVLKGKRSFPIDTNIVNLY